MTAAAKIKKFLRDHEPDMFGLLERMVRINSGSRNKAGVDRVGHLVQSAFAGTGASCRILENDDFGNNLIARTPACETAGKQILLTGHMDTVFPEDTDFNWYREDADHAYGPGVCDMKGGLVVGICALKALDAAGLLADIPVTFIFNSDEEIGSPGSRDLIRAEADKSAAAFVLEAGGLNDEVVVGRKGNLSIEVRVKGRAGHAAFAGPDKASAILELAHKTIRFEAMNDPENGVTANVGTVAGGIGPNTVPDRASGRVDFRFKTAADADAVQDKIQQIAEMQIVPGATSEVDIRSQRPPMPVCPANLALFETVRRVAEGLGQSVQAEFRNGVSDANIIAGRGVPVLDGLGPVGARDHSPDEYMVKKSLLERAMLLALTLVDLRKNGTI